MLFGHSSAMVDVSFLKTFLGAAMNVSSREGAIRHPRLLTAGSCYHPPPSATAYNTCKDLDRPHSIIGLHCSL